MQYTTEELAKLIKQVEDEFAAHLTKAEAEQADVLAKSEKVTAPTQEAAKEQPLEKAEEKEEKKEEPKAEAKEESKEAPKEETKEAPKDEHEEESKEAPKEEAKEHAEEHKPEHEDDHGYDDEDMEHMHKMYQSMSKGELKAHHGAISKAYEHHGLAKCGDISMAKSETIEIKAEDIKPNPELELLKSEVKSQKAENEELKKTLEAVKGVVSLLAKKTAPQGKAITGLDVIEKSESIQEEKPLSKSEITSILAKKAAEPTLSKADREAINAYYFNGAVSTNTINHLLK
jgi:hypothetical protein